MVRIPIEYSFGGFLHPLTMLVPIPPFSLLLPTSALAPHTALVSMGLSCAFCAEEQELQLLL